jgi:hypothetical protein
MSRSRPTTAKMAELCPSGTVPFWTTRLLRSLLRDPPWEFDCGKDDEFLSVQSTSKILRTMGLIPC